MADLFERYVPNKTTDFFSKMSKLVYLVGFPNFWVEDLKFSKSFVKFYNWVSSFINVFLYIFVCLEIGSFFTQHDLTEKQYADRLVFGFSQPILCLYRVIMTYHQDLVTELLLKLSVELKEVYNDPEIEKKMIRKAKFCSVAFLSLCAQSLVFYGYDAMMRSLQTGVPFSTVITAWPEIQDQSDAASVMRIAGYFAWWMLMSRVFGAYLLVVSIVVCLEYQYKNLQSYFNNLNNIFENEKWSKHQRELKYVESLRVGIKLHSETLWCTRQAQATCSTVFEGQTLLNICVLVLLMLQMMNSDRSLESVFAIVTTSVATLISTGFFMWTAGDVTVEASHLPMAMYCSGWHNCEQSAVAIRKLLVIAMMQAQKPVAISGFGMVLFSYQAYLSIVKTSYSVFSVLY
uniref:Odorant receptor n=1 Tax=Heortia vitessoides TaxID=1557813 RepID=A0A978W731_9NEOP|nr:odorant receptor 34 [Heortia vitessoides]